ncbi:hypothetical protein TNCV_3169111 [Trichonephila clavipes]|nr:hypothetical protein TNCV_3169111 [Trichonephila clavipes]
MHKTNKLKSSGRNVNKTSDSDGKRDLVKEKNYLFRQNDFLNSMILDTKLKEPNKSEAHFVKNANYTYIKRRTSDNQKEPSSEQDSNYDQISTDLSN